MNTRETLDTLVIREATREEWREQFDKTDGTWFCFVVENPASRSSR